MVQDLGHREGTRAISLYMFQTHVDNLSGIMS